jgi:NAD-dependent SIR2 family protein deacetylase
MSDGDAATAIVTGEAASEALAAFVAGHRRLYVLTGAGCSTDSGIPDYRDGAGAWKRSRPMQWAEFAGSEQARKRYWARSMVGWSRVEAARPNAAHEALARLEAAGQIARIVTQNVDGLHQQAGSRRVIDLHGRLDRVECLECGGTMGREAFQTELLAANPDWAALDSGAAPDGDADLERSDYSGFRVPGCHGCGGTLRPSVVFFGESVPMTRVNTAMAALDDCDGVLVVGSSLMVWSGLRFIRAARQRGLACAAINLGRTRADEDLAFRAAVPCDHGLVQIERHRVAASALP